METAEIIGLWILPWAYVAYAMLRYLARRAARWGIYTRWTRLLPRLDTDEEEPVFGIVDVIGGIVFFTLGFLFIYLFHLWDVRDPSSFSLLGVCFTAGTIHLMDGVVSMKGY